MALAPSRRRAVADRYHALHARVARRLAAHLRTFFRQQARRVVDRYLGHHGVVKLDRDPTADSLLPRDEDEQLLLALEVYLATMIITSSELAALLAGGSPLELQSVAVRALLAEALNPIRGISEVSRQAIARHLAEGRAAGYTVEQIAYGIPDVGYPSLGALVESVYANRAEAIAATETSRIAALSVAETYRESGIQLVEILDGPVCGWRFHNDPDLADGSTRTIQEYRATPLSHPWCVRQALPVRTG